MPYVHAVNVAATAARVRSAYQRYLMVEALQIIQMEPKLLVAFRQGMLCLTVALAVSRAVISSATRGRLFWASYRLLAAGNAVAIALAVAVLRVTVDPPLYPPNDVPMHGGLLLAALLAGIAAAITPANRRWVSARVSHRMLRG